MEQGARAELCFGGMNCDVGYVGFYDECFRGAERLYTIKGGPGTGKSYLMRQIAKGAMARGEEVRLIHCGSDAGSLDGVYLPGRRIGVLDGTSPHPREPQMPGIDGEILNVGQFWNADTLLAQKEEIVALNREKSEGYASVYRYFAAMRQLRLEVRERLEASLDQEKLEKAARRAMDAIRGEGEMRVCQRRAIGMGGDVYLTDQAEPILIGVSDECEGGSRYLGALHKRAQEKGIACQVSYHPIYHDEIQTLTFPGSGLAYTAATDLAVTRNIHMRRFRDREAYVRLRSECRDLAKMAQVLREKAIRRFGDIRDAHFRIEKHYTAAMDFEALDKYNRRVIITLLVR